MANPVGKYKFWDSTIANGLGTASTDFFPALEAELDSWITAISGNASLAGAVPVKQKGVADSTNANYLGLVVELPHATNPSTFAAVHSISSSSIYQRISSTWTDNGTNNGYGAFGGTSTAEATPWTATGIDMGIFLAYDTTDEEEFFVAGRWDTGVSGDHDPLIIMVRGTNGDWSATAVDGTTSAMLWYSEVDAQHKTRRVLQDSAAEMTVWSSATDVTPYSIGAGSSFVSANTRLLTANGGSDTGSYFGDTPYSAYATARYGPVVIIG